MGKVQATLDKLNNLQLDECAASKALVATIASPMSDNAQISEDINNFKLSTGVSSLWSDTVTKMKASGGAVTSGEVDALLTGCSEEAKQAFGAPGSVLAHLGEKLGYPTSHVDAVRAIFGDVVVKKDAGYALSFDPPCSGALGVDLDRMVQGDSMTKPVGGKCIQMKKGTQSLVDYSKQILNSVRSKISSKSAVSLAEQATLESTSLPIQSVMQLAVRTGETTSLIDDFGPLVAYEKAYRMVLGLSLIAEQTGAVSKNILSNSSERKNDCRIHLVDGTAKSFENLTKKSAEVRASVRKQYADKLAKGQATLSRLSKLQSMQKQNTSEMKSHIIQSWQKPN